MTARFKSNEDARDFYRYLLAHCDDPNIDLRLDANDVEIIVTSEHSSAYASRLYRDAVLGTGLMPVTTF